MLEEEVEIWSLDPSRKLSTSRLAVGEHGLPVLLNTYPPTEVWMFPAAWELCYVLQNKEPILYPAWCAIEALQRQIATAQREAEDEERGQARNRETSNRISEELEEGR